MKKILYTILPLLFMAAGADAQTTILDGQVTVGATDVYLNGDKVFVSFSLDVSGLKVKSNREVILTPELRDTAGNVSRLPEIWLVGRNRYFYQQRNGTAAEGKYFYRKKKLSSVLYEVSVPYEPWMKYADLAVSNEVCGCSELLTSGENMLYSPFVPMFVYVSPPVEMTKVRDITGSAFIDFPVSQTVIYPEYRDNPAELAKIRSTIDAVENDPDARIVGISIKGFASPESPYSNNTRLAKGRTEALMEYVREQYGFPAEIFSTSYEPEDWEGLRDFVAASSLPDRDAILELIDRDMDPDLKEREIKENHRSSYEYLLQICYPALRHSDYEVKYVLRTYTDVKEMKRLLETTPGKLSLYEMYQIASTYEEGSDEYNELVEIMVHLFPNDEVANLNAANVAMYKEDLESAEKYLGKAGQGPEAVYARGLLAALKGDYATAEQYVTEAGEQGVAEAAECLERIRRAALE